MGVVALPLCPIPMISKKKKGEIQKQSTHVYLVKREITTKSNTRATKLDATLYYINYNTFWSDSCINFLIAK